MTGSRNYYYSATDRDHDLDVERHHYYAGKYESVPYETRRPPQHQRRPSTSVPQRPSTARPAGESSSSSSQPRTATASSTSRKATAEDARRYRIPAGYSLKNWDPTDEPLILLGSVFDAHTLGKWIYDWTVYKHGASHSTSDMAGELWLLLIQFYGKVKRAENCMPRIRCREEKEMVEDFIDSGERLGDKLKKLLKTCEAPMLKTAKNRRGGQLGNNAGVEFVLTLFGKERELEKTEHFMTSIRLWNLRFDANCEDILKDPTGLRQRTISTSPNNTSDQTPESLQEGRDETSTAGRETTSTADIQDTIDSNTPQQANLAPTEPAEVDAAIPAVS
jgi:hypothetical protein